jgi:hypothetical protein
LAANAAGVLAFHTRGKNGNCVGCRKVLGEENPHPCTFVRLAGLGEEIAAGNPGGGL